MRTFSLMFVLTLLSCFSSSIFAQALPPESEPQTSFWFERRLGHVIVTAQKIKGVTEPNLAYGYYFAAIGPRPATVNKGYGNCLREAVKDAGTSFVNSLSDEANLFVPVIEPIRSERQVTRTQNALVTARGEFRKAIIAHCQSVGRTDPLRKYIDGTGLALIRRECTAKHCPGLAVPEPPRADGEISEGERRERVFEAVYYWTLIKGFDVTLNQALLLDFDGSGGLAPRVVEYRPGEDWPNRKSPEETQKYFEAGVARILENSNLPRLSPTIASQINLPRPTILRTSIAFRDPQDAYFLGIEAPELKLRSLQDEVARIRLAECKLYRDFENIAEVTKCAGYSIEQTALLDCLNGGPCMPQLAVKADAGALLQASRYTVGDLRLGAYIPRPYSDKPGSFVAMVDTYKACASNKDPSSAAACLVRQSASPNIATQTNCLLERTGANRLDCLTTTTSSRRALEQLRSCVERNSRGCAIEAALPPEWACVAGAKSAGDLKCLTGNLGGDVGRITECLKNKSDAGSRLLCIGGDSIPTSVRQMAACYTTSSSEAAMAACVVGTTLPPEQETVVKCAVESGGDPMAAGVCVAMPLLNLEHSGQKIILQCAASSGGEPITAATCMAGRFTLIELQGCKTAEFGSTGCFGDGNEFQKLAIAITGTKISSESVVGQIVIAHVRVADAVTGVASHALNELSKGGKNTVDGIGRSLENLRKNPLQELANTPENVARELGKGIENLARNVINTIIPGSLSW